MKREKKFECKRHCVRNLFTVAGYEVKDVYKNTYILWAKNMENACNLAWTITGETDIYKAEKYIKPYDKKQGVQHIRPSWWYGRVYSLTR